MSATAHSTSSTHHDSAGAAVIAGRVLTGLAVVFLVFDAGGKLFSAQTSVDGTVAMGYAEGDVPVIGAVLAVITLAYAIPRTAVVGALFLTAYLGGAVASMIISGEGWPAFAIGFAVVAWAGLCLRRPALVELLRGA